MRSRAKPRQTRQRFSQPVGDPRDSRGLYAAMRRFVTYRAVLGSTEVALHHLEANLRYFIGWADERSVTHPQHVTRAVLERYQRWLHHYRKKDGMPLSITSQRDRLSVLRSLFKWLTRSGEIPANPAADIDLPRMRRRISRHVLTAQEVEHILTLPNLGSPFGLRDRAMMEVLYATGMRRMEIAQLAINDIDVERAVVLIREGKGQKDRLIPLGRRALYWVQRYLDHAREQLAWDQADATLFLSRYGQAMNLAQLSKKIGSYVEKAQLGKRGGCHLFRHTMATLMLEGGADIRFIQAMLGHADMSTTQIYTQVAIKQLQIVHANTHPGVLKPAASVPTAADERNPQPAAENVAEALLAALEAEAAEEDAMDEESMDEESMDEESMDDEEER